MRPDAEVAITRLTLLDDWRRRLAELDPIFFEASLTKTFPSSEARNSFRERWLGRFLERWPELTHVAVGSSGELLGYIVGTHDDPAQNPAFADIGFYRELQHHTVRFPAHLHINLAAEARNRGIGARLVEAFMNDARAAGVGGLHLVTGRDSRNRSFYARCGFGCVAELVWGGTSIVMLARPTLQLPPSPSSCPPKRTVTTR